MKCKLKDVCTKIGSGSTPRGGKDAYCSKGISLIRSQNVLDYSFSELGLAFINEEQAKKLSNVVVEKNDILLNITGDSVARACKVDNSKLPARVNQHVCIIRPNESVVLSSYVLYYLQLNKEYLLQLAAGGATRKALTKDMISNMEIDIPNLENQRKIISIIDDIQDKIKTNINIINNLSEQSQLFYKKFNYNSHDWKKVTVGDVVTLQRGYDLPKTKMIKGKYPVAGSTDTIFYHNQYMAEPPCIVLGRSGNIGKPRLYLDPCWPHNTSLFTKQFKNSNPLWVYFMLYNLDYSMFQGGSAVPTLNRNHIHSYAIKIPPIAEQNKFAQTIEPLIKAIFHNRKEIETLSKLRDTLLPRLMSGEIDVSCVS